MSNPRLKLYLKFIAVAIIVVAISGLIFWKASLFTSSKNNINNQQPMGSSNDNPENSNTYTPSTEEWKQITAVSRGVNISFDVVNFDPPFHFNQVSTQDLNTDSPVQTSAMYYRLLSEGKIEAASAVTTDPARTIETMKAYQSRRGADAFRDEMSKYFTNTVSIIAIARTENAYLLIIKDNDLGSTAVQVFQETDGKFKLMSDNSKISDETGLIISYFTDRNQ